MPKRVKKRKVNEIESNYNLRSKSKRNKINEKSDVINDYKVNNSQNCEQLDINVSTMSSSSLKLTKMPNKYYNLRRRGIGTNNNSHELRHKSSDVQLNDLPDDCLLIIFENLDTIRDKCYVQSVCKRFKFLINRLLKAQKVFSVNSTFGSNPKSQQILSKQMCNNVITKCPTLQTFKMPGFYAKDNSSETNERIGDKEMHDLSINCKDLRELDICGCGNVSETGINEIIKNCSHLEKLSISFCTHVYGVSFKKLTKNFKQLCLNGNEMTPSLENSLKFLKAGNGKHLTELNVCLYNTLNSQDDILELICNSFEDLECLRYSIFSRNACKFGKFGRLKNLTHLAFDSNSMNLNDEEFIKIMEGLSQLKSLFIRYDVIKDQTTVTDYSLRKLPIFCPHLEKFHFHPKNDLIKTITDCSIINFVQLRQLESLSLKLFENIGDSVINVIKCCPKLKSISLLNCHKVTNATIDALIIAAKAHPLKKIKYNISGDNFKFKKKKLPSNLIDCSDDNYIKD